MADAKYEGWISYATDVEGDLAYWRRFLEVSAVLNRDSASGEIHLVDGAQFVFGGDAVDQNSGDLEVLKELVTLKRKYPDRVHLILGNRDNNKLRLLLELGQAHRDALSLRDHPGPYWAKGSKPAAVLTEDELEDNSVASRLRWILKHTMGATNTFEDRRAELSRRENGRAVSDDEVAQSFLDYVSPGGLLFEYVSLGRLAVQVGNALFVHAGLPRGSDGWVPGWVPAWEEGSQERQLPVIEWIAELERLRSHAMAQVSAQAGNPLGADAWCVNGGYTHQQAGAVLVQYGMRDLPCGRRQPSVVYNGWLTDDYQPIQPDDATIEWLRSAGITSIASGHLPHGDAPLVLRVAEGIHAVTADTSYAMNTMWEGEEPPPPSQKPERGERTVCEVLFGPEPATGRIHGMTANGLRYEADLRDEIIGKVTIDGWRVKARVGQQLLMSRNERWSFTNKLVDPAEVSWSM
eukprot:TRINITY_DN25674_c0_g1_i1.p1 TRINITY_DN25674_c0_g1~~TRINITY_DN25674_c0_g1_i1.p1  ORF type:complete len:463 (+),score=63.08 TRINITY_DN25674_c0_g1_i1:139-1527(+)